MGCVFQFIRDLQQKKLCGTIAHHSQLYDGAVAPYRKYGLVFAGRLGVYICGFFAEDFSRRKKI